MGFRNQDGQWEISIRQVLSKPFDHVIAPSIQGKHREVSLLFESACDWCCSTVRYFVWKSDELKKRLKERF